MLLCTTRRAMSCNVFLYVAASEFYETLRHPTVLVWSILYEVDDSDDAGWMQLMRAKPLTAPLHLLHLIR